MIFTFVEPLILASEFVTHIVLVVLAGVVVLEYACRRIEHFGFESKKKAAFYSIAGITVLGTLWVFMDYFGGFAIPRLFTMRYLLLLGIIALVIYLAREARKYPRVIHIPKVLGIGLVVAIIVFLTLDTFYRLSGNPIAGLLYANSRIVGVLTYYFFIMKYLVVNGHENA